jgi:hypothetical protein
MTLLLLLCGLGDRASAKALCPENIASRGFQGTAWECVLGVEPQAIESQWDEAALQPGMALDVCNGPNVYTYVKQNPWTKFDPDGLFMQAVGNWLGERWQAPSVVRSMANHTDTVVNTAHNTLAVASAVPALGKVADVCDAAISAAEGNYTDAGIVLAGGVYGKTASKLNKALNIAEGGADVRRIIKEGGEQIRKQGDEAITTARETAKSTVKDVAQETGESAAKRTKQGGKLTEPDLPPKTIVKDGKVEVVHYTRSGDHGPAHLHVKGGGKETKIGQAGKPIDGSSELSPAQSRVIKEHKKEIRKSVDQIQRWKKFEDADG